MTFKIGNVQIANQVCLAPMASIGNSAFRRIIKEFGCGLVYAEMVSNKAILHGSKKTKKLLYLTEYERPIAQQIFGSDKESFVEAAKIIYELTRPDIIDINMGCPVPKVAIKSQAGACLLKYPDKIYDIVSAVVGSVPCPVTVKIRSGWDSGSINAVEVASICEKAGASAIAVHPRTRSQGYSGKADWDIIKQVKKAVTIPVIGNGDIKSAEDAKKMLDETDCDAIMIGRATIGNPWIIKEIVHYLDNGVILNKPTISDKVDMCKKHLNYLLENKDEKTALVQIKNHATWYLKGIPHINRVKKDIHGTRNVSELLEIFDKYLQQAQINIKYK
jgi:tRNA-dihydrouridine synthase B